MVAPLKPNVPFCDHYWRCAICCLFREMCFIHLSSSCFPERRVRVATRFRRPVDTWLLSRATVAQSSTSNSVVPMSPLKQSRARSPSHPPSHIVSSYIYVCSTPPSDHPSYSGQRYQLLQFPSPSCACFRCTCIIIR